MRSKCENCGAALVNGVCSRHCTALNPPTMRELWGTVPDLRAPVDDGAAENAALRARVALLREALATIAHITLYPDTPEGERRSMRPASMSHLSHSEAAPRMHSIATSALEADHD